MTAADWVLDATLATALPIVAWRAIRASVLSTAIVLFLAFGLLSSFAWARLGAPDIALVEASVGTGLAAALFISAVSWAPTERLVDAPRPYVLELVSLALMGVLAPGVAALPSSGGGLSDSVAARLADTGVSQPVTAVLMSFRGYDTLLETMVLLVAAAGAWTLHAAEPLASGEPPGLLLLSSLLAPLVVLLAGYLVWRGSHAPGGAFQAGAVLAGGAVVLAYSRRASLLGVPSGVVRTLVVLGPASFLALAAVPAAFGGQLLEYPRAWSAVLVTAEEVVLAVSIGVTLALFLPLRRPGSSGGPP